MTKKKQITLEEKICSWCWAPFTETKTTGRKQNCCSRKCSKSFYSCFIGAYKYIPKKYSPTLKPSIGMNCKYCEKYFNTPPSWKSTVFCSRRCGVFYSNSKMTKRQLEEAKRNQHCGFCNKTFTKVRIYQKFCCTSCQSNGNIYTKKYYKLYQANQILKQLTKEIK